MRTYINKRTGAAITVSCALEGPDWVECTDKAKEPTKTETPVKAAPKKKAVRKGADA